MGLTGAGETTLQRIPTSVAEAEMADAALAASGLVADAGTNGAAAAAR